MATFSSILAGTEEHGGLHSHGQKNVVACSLLLLLSCFSRVRLCAAPETAAHQAPPSLGFSRQEHWSGLPFPSPMAYSLRSHKELDTTEHTAVE